MPTKEELLRQELALLERRRGLLMEQVDDPTVSRTQAAIANLGQGLTFRFADEIGSTVTAAGRAPFSEQTFGEIREQELAKRRGALEEAREQFPVTSTVSEVLGGVAQGGGIAGLGKAALTRVPNLLRLSGLGAVEGGLFGAGGAEEGSRVGQAALGAGVGAVGAPLGAGAVNLAGRAGRVVGRPISNILANTPRRQAERAVREALEVENLGPLTVQQRLQELGPRAVLADVGEATSARAQALVGKSGRARNVAKNLLDDRQRGQRSELLSAAGVDFDVGDFRRGFQSFLNGRITRADPLYKEAFGSPLDLSSREAKAILARPSVQKAFRQAEKVLRDEGGGAGNVKLVQAAKEVLDDDIGLAIRQGKRNQAARLLNNKRALLGLVDEQVPAYRQARELFAGEAALKDAANLGRGLFGRRLDLDDVDLAVQSMTGGERHAFRLGAIRGLIDKLDSAPDTRNQAKKLFESPRAREILGLAFPDDETLSNFINTAKAESVFSQSRNAILGGSPTFARQQAGQDLESVTGLLGAVTGDGGLVSSGVSILRQIGVGDASEEALEEMANILFSPQIPQRQLNRIAGQNLLQRVPQTIREGATVGGITPLLPIEQ